MKVVRIGIRFSYNLLYRSLHYSEYFTTRYMLKIFLHILLKYKSAVDPRAVELLYSYPSIYKCMKKVIIIFLDRGALFIYLFLIYGRETYNIELQTSCAEVTNIMQ